MGLLEDNYSAEEIRKRKEIFALAYARSQSNAHASRAAFDDEFAYAFDWEKDPFVQALIEQHTQTDTFTQVKIMSKNEFLFRLQQKIVNPKTSEQMQIKCFELFAEAQQFVGRGAQSGMSITNAVIVMPAETSDAEWELQARLQQQKLLSSVEH